MKRLKLFICIAMVLYLGICPVLTANSFFKVNSDAMEQAEIKTNNTISKLKSGLLPSCSVSWSMVFAVLILATAILGYYGGLSSGCVVDPIMQALAFLPMCVSYLLLGVHGLIVVAIVTVVSIFIGALGTSE